MNSPIKVGDLVQVVRGKPCCGYIGPKTGTYFIVTAIVNRGIKACPNCHKESVFIKLLDGSGQKGWRIERCERIPPLAELEQAEDKEELPA
jgi:hypothetical protein